MLRIKRDAPYYKHLRLRQVGADGACRAEGVHDDAVVGAVEVQAGGVVLVRQQ